MIPWLEIDTPFPDVSKALTVEAPGLLAAGADLSPARLLQAYRNGIFPWFSEGQPILWWSTDPRMVLYTDQFKVSNSLAKTLRKIERSRLDGGRWDVRFDSAFDDVMRACAAPRRDGPGTWISDEIIAGYTGLHALGYARMACASAACSMASRCSRACPMRPRSRSPIWWRFCSAMASRWSTASKRLAIWPRLAQRRSRAAAFSSTSAARPPGRASGHGQ
jgi:hypothetical protein